MKRRRLILIVGVLAVLALAGGGWWWARAAEVRTVVVSALPARPDLRAWPQELRGRIEQSERGARSLFGAARELGELARLYHANGFLREAGRCYEGLAWIEPDEPRWLHRHAAILAGFGEVGTALVLERRVVGLAPEYLPAGLRLGDLLLKNNQPGKATEVYGEILERRADEPYAQLGLARVAFEAGRWEEARQRLEPLVARTNYLLGYDLIVTVYERLGLGERAAAVRSQGRASGAFRDAPDPWLDELMDACFDPYRLGVASGSASRAGDLDTALRLLERAAAQSPRDISTLFQLGGLCRERKEFSRALGYFEQCTTLAPEFADGWANVSALRAQLRDAAGAEKALAEGLRNCPESPGLHVMRARALAQAGRRAEAVAAYRRATQFRSNEADAFIELAGVLFELGQVEDGLREVEKSLVAEPENPQALGLMALHAISTANEAAARQWLRRVRDQPRVAREQRERLLAAFREQFGRGFE